MIKIYIENKKYKVNEDDNLLKSCLSLGFDIPYFCWHPALGSIGACRLCAVKQYKSSKDKYGSLVMSCMTKVTEGIYISINDEETKQFRRSIVELLMINHPHDCPVCEEGGNCHLQDMTVMTGHNLRRYRFNKRTHYNQDLGPFISHEMNRCITCYRCIRFYKDYAGGKDLGIYGTHNNIYFGRLKDGMMENEFSGNLVEICPTGVFTDKTYSKHFSRKWDMQYSPSICHQCSVGCNITPGERYGKICRIENRYNGAVNHYFLCDRGRFGYEYVNLKDRPRQPFYRGIDNNLTNLNFKQAIQIAANILRKSKRTIGIGSSRACIESNFALREIVGSKNFYKGIAYGEQERLQLILKILRKSGVRTPSLREIESYDAILILGEDVTQTGARIALAIRQAVKNKEYKIAALHKIAYWNTAAVMNAGQNAKNPLFITSIDTTSLDHIATWVYRAPVEDQARLGFAIAHVLDNEAPAVKNLHYNLQKKANEIANILVNAKKPLIVSGTSLGSTEILKAASNVAKALKSREVNVGITMVASEVNSIGLSMMDGGSLDEALKELESNSADSVIILENDLYRHASATRIDAAFVNKMLVIAIDHQLTETTDKAHIVFSAASFVESSGTVINNEGRAQRFFQVYDPSYYDKNTVILESWYWLHHLQSSINNCQVTWTKLDDVINSLAEKLPKLSNIKKVAPDSSFRFCGQKLARQPYCYSGRTAMNANISVHEQSQPQDEDTMFAFSMEGNNQPLASRSEIPFAWVPGWNSPQAWNKFQNEINGHIYHSDPGLRLIENFEKDLEYFTDIPISFYIQKGNWRVAPYYYLFGSEELSQRSPVLRDIISKLCMKLNSSDADKLGFIAGKNIALEYDGRTITLPLEISEVLSAGQIGLPIGVLGIIPAIAGVIINNLHEV